MIKLGESEEKNSCMSCLISFSACMIARNGNGGDKSVRRDGEANQDIILNIGSIEIIA